MARFRWTDEAVAELRRLLNYQMSHREIAARLGTTENAIRIKTSRLGWAAFGSGHFANGQRLKGKKRPAEVMERVAAASRARAQDPEYRARLQEFGRREAANPKRLKRSIAAMDRKRGGAIPADQRAEFDRIRAKKIPSREAFAMLPKTPSNAIAIKGA